MCLRSANYVQYRAVPAVYCFRRGRTPVPTLSPSPGRRRLRKRFAACPESPWKNHRVKRLRHQRSAFANWTRAATAARRRSPDRAVEDRLTITRLPAGTAAKLRPARLFVISRGIIPFTRQRRRVLHARRSVGSGAACRPCARSAGVGKSVCSAGRSDAHYCVRAVSGAQ